MRLSRTSNCGRILFAVGLGGLGVLSLISGDFAYTWQPVPAWVPAREILARLSGLLLLAGGVGLLLPRRATLAALVMTGYLLIWVLLLQLPAALAAPGSVGAWLGFAENLVLMTGGWTLFATLSTPDDGPRRAAFLTTARSVRVAQLLFAAACIELGISHFAYTDATASMIPAWIPFHRFFAYLTGSGHLATGVAVFTGLIPRLATRLEAAMITLFVLLLHLPAVLAQPGNRLLWTMVFVATALAGAVWSLSATFAVAPSPATTTRPAVTT